MNEANLLDKYIMNHKDELQANKRDYTEICFETGSCSGTTMIMEMAAIIR